MSNDTKKTVALFGAGGQPIHFPILSPDDIAGEVWSLVTKRDRVEAVLPAPPAN